MPTKKIFTRCICEECGPKGRAMLESEVLAHLRATRSRQNSSSDVDNPVTEISNVNLDRDIGGSEPRTSVPTTNPNMDSVITGLSNLNLGAPVFSNGNVDNITMRLSNMTLAQDSSQLAQQVFSLAYTNARAPPHQAHCVSLTAVDVLEAVQPMLSMPSPIPSVSAPSSHATPRGAANQRTKRILQVLDNVERRIASCRHVLSLPVGSFGPLRDELAALRRATDDITSSLETVKVRKTRVHVALTELLNELNTKCPQSLDVSDPIIVDSRE